MAGRVVRGARARAVRGARRLVVSVVLTVLLVLSGVPGGLPDASAATTTIKWDSRADFEHNATTTGETTTLSSISTARSPGSMMPLGVNVGIAVGSWHSVGLRTDGTVVAVGQNDFGQKNVSTWTDITQVTARRDHTVGLKSGRSVVATGLNDFGQCDVSAWTDIIAVSAGAKHTVGLKADGTVVVAVGSNYDGQCGVSTWTDIISVAGGNPRPHR